MHFSKSLETRILGTVLGGPITLDKRFYAAFREVEMFYVKNFPDLRVMIIEPGAEKHNRAFSMLLLPLRIT